MNKRLKYTGIGVGVLGVSIWYLSMLGAFITLNPVRVDYPEINCFLIKEKIPDNMLIDNIYTNWLLRQINELLEFTVTFATLQYDLIEESSAQSVTCIIFNITFPTHKETTKELFDEIYETMEKQILEDKEFRGRISIYRLPAARGIYLEFPFLSQLSYWMAKKRVYPALLKFAEEFHFFRDTMKKECPNSGCIFPIMRKEEMLKGHIAYFMPIDPDYKQYIIRSRKTKKYAY